MKAFDIIFKAGLLIVGAFAVYQLGEIDSKLDGIDDKIEQKGEGISQLAELERRVDEVENPIEELKPFGKRNEAGEVAATSSPLLDKIKWIVIPGVNFSETPLDEVLNTLMQYSRANDFAEPDPTAKGVNLIPMLLGKPAPQVTITLKKMTLEKMLDFITEMVGWTYEVRTDAIVVSKEG